MDELGEALEDENYEWLAEIGDMDYGDFANGNVESVIIDYTGDWDDPIAYKLVRYSYEEKLNQIQATYQKEQEELNKLFNI